jgi:hypothetical protein
MPVELNDPLPEFDEYQDRIHKLNYTFTDLRKYLGEIEVDVYRIEEPCRTPCVECALAENITRTCVKAQLYKTHMDNIE